MLVPVLVLVPRLIADWGQHVVSVCLRVVATMLSEAFHRLRTVRERVGNSHTAQGNPKRTGPGAKTGREASACSAGLQDLWVVQPVEAGGLGFGSEAVERGVSVRVAGAGLGPSCEQRGDGARTLRMGRLRLRFPPPPPRTKWTRRVPQTVLIGHAARHGSGRKVETGGGGEAAGVTAKCSGVRFSCPPACWLGSAWLSRSSESIGGNPFAAATWDKFARGCSMHHRIVQPPGAARGRSGSGASPTQHGAPGGVAMGEAGGGGAERPRE